MDTRSAKYPATHAGVKRGLKAANLSQRQAALATGQSTALICMVLQKKITSQPCLNKLAALIAKTLATKNGVAA